VIKQLIKLMELIKLQQLISDKIINYFGVLNP